MTGIRICTEIIKEDECIMTGVVENECIVASGVEEPGKSTVQNLYKEIMLNYRFLSIVWIGKCKKKIYGER